MSESVSVLTKKKKKKKAPIQRDVTEKSFSKGYVFGRVSRAEEVNTKKGLFGSQK